MNSNQPGSSTASLWDSLQAATQVAQAIITLMDHGMAAGSNALMASLQPVIAPLTEVLGRVVAPIADLPLIRFATGVPGLKWLLAAVGQVNRQAVEQRVAQLRADHPQDSNRQLTQRVMGAATMRAAEVGLVTNLVSPLALTLLWVDVGAIAALQADMIYQIAAIYGYSAEDPARRGEVLAIWLLFSAGGSVLKTGLSAVEIIPGLGAVVGIASDASLLYGVGYLACRFYETKTSGTDSHFEA